MKTLTLRTKILVSVGCIIFLVFGTNTLIHIQDVKGDYLEALTWRSEALAQDIINEITDMQSLRLDDIEDMFPPLTLRCIKLYELNKDKNVSHFAVIDAAGNIGPHNDRERWDTPVTSPRLLEHLQRRQQLTVLDQKTYHTLVPVFGEQGEYLVSIDIGIPRRVVDEKVQRVILQASGLFVVFLGLAVFTISFLMHMLLTKPVRHLVFLGQQLAAGQLVHIPQPSEQGDEVAVLTAAFHRISVYFSNVAEVATAISTGDLRGQVIPRSQQDALGTAFQRMTAYLNRLATAAATIAGGDLRQEAQPESEHDVLGNAFHTMAVQLRENFEKIHQEVTERTRAQEALERLNEVLEQRVKERTAELTREKYILETLMNTVPDSIYFKDREGRITNANKAHATEHGFNDPSEEIGKINFDLLPEDLARMTHEQEQKIIDTGEPLLDREYPIPKPDGSIRWSLVTKMPLRDEKGEVIGTFGLSRDITSQKQASASLEQAYSEILSLNHHLQEDTLRYYMKALLLGAPAVPLATTLPASIENTWNAPYFGVVLVKLLPVHTNAINLETDWNMIGFLRELYDDYTGSITIDGILSYISDMETALILNPSEYSLVRNLCEYIGERSASVLQEYGYSMIISIGDAVTTPEELHISYDSAQQSTFARRNMPQLQILSSQDTERHKRDALMFYFPVEKEQQLITAVIAGQTAQAQELVQDIITQNSLEHSSYRKLMAVYDHFLHTAGKVLAQAPVQESGTGEAPLLHTFRAAKPETILKFRERTDEVFRQLLKLYTRHDANQIGALTHKLFRYLDRHFSDPTLSLNSIAEAFTVNPSYLSRYFKQQTGVNYVAYLAMLRVKNAKNLLLAHPTHNIQDIALRAGFSGKETFIRTFKRFEGVTPGTYRKRALSNAEI